MLNIDIDKSVHIIYITKYILKINKFVNKLLHTYVYVRIHIMYIRTVRYLNFEHFILLNWISYRSYQEG